MKKKILSTLLALTLSSSMLYSTASAITMYAPDGRTASVADADVEAWKAVGWYDKNYIIMYAPGRKTARVSLQNINAWKKVGWYEQPTITEYYSCNKLVPKYDNIVHTDFLGKFEKENVIIYRYKYTSVTDYEAYFYHMINDGWKVQTTNIDNETLDAYMTKGSSKIGIHVIIKYEEVWISLINSTSTVTMYAPDGRTSEVAKTDVDAWKKVGWYEVPVTTVYARDGRTEVIAKSDVEAWKKVGWSDKNYITMYAADGRTSKVLLTDIAAWKKVGWYEHPVECNHNWKEATCYSPKTCTICGKTKGEAKGHSYYKSNGKCSDCGKQWLIYEHNGIKIYFLGITYKYSWLMLNLEIVNNSYDTEMIQVRDSTVNGYMIDYTMSDTVLPGKRIITDIKIRDNDLISAGIYDYNNANTFEFKFRFCDSNFESHMLGMYFQ